MPAETRRPQAGPLGAPETPRNQPLSASLTHQPGNVNPGGQSPRSHGEWLAALVGGGWLRRLSDLDRRVLLALVAHARRQGGTWTAWPRVDTLAVETGTSTWRVSRALSRLETCGLIRSTCRSGGRGRATEWQVLLPPGATLAAPETPTLRMGVSEPQTPTPRVRVSRKKGHPPGAKRVTLWVQPGMAETQTRSGFQPFFAQGTNIRNQENTATQQDPLPGAFGASPLRGSGGAGHSGGAQGTSLQPATPRPGISPAGEGGSSIPADGNERAPAKGRAPKRVAGTTQAPPRRPNPAADAARELARRWGIPGSAALRAVKAAARMAGGVDRVHQVVLAIPAGPAPQDPVSRLVAACRAEVRRRADLEEAMQYLVAAGLDVDVAEALAQWMLDRGLGPAAVRRLAPEAAALAAGNLREALERAPRTMHGWDAWRWLRDAVRPQRAAPATTSAPRFRF
jgi:hypothetical protein